MPAIGFNALFLAMSHWQLGRREEANRQYDAAVRWMRDNDVGDEELLRFCQEAAKLLGRTEDRGKVVRSEESVMKYSAVCLVTWSLLVLLAGCADQDARPKKQAVSAERSDTATDRAKPKKRSAKKDTSKRRPRQATGRRRCQV